VNGDAIPICVVEGRGDDRAHRDVFELSDSLQEIADLTRFDFELMRVVDVLVGAAAAPTKIRTGRFDAIRRRLSNFDNLSFGKLLFLADDFRRNKFAVDGERNKDGFPIFARDAFSAKRDVFDLEIDNSQASTLTALDNRRI
jgi:hypothetical protein